jgi:prepilin peptidase CpaA
LCGPDNHGSHNRFPLTRVDRNFGYAINATATGGITVRVSEVDAVFVGLALLCACIGAFRDVRTRRIPNWLTLPSMLTALALHLVIGPKHWQSLGSAALAGLIGGGVFLIFHLAGGMGAGDVKLMTAVCCFAGLSYLPEILIATALMGGVFAVIVAVSRHRLKETLSNIGVLAVHHGTSGLRPHSDLNVSNAERLRLPYGVAIAAGSAVSFCSVLLR